MYKEWGFFRALVSNADMVLAKTDLTIASHYAELVQSRTLREKIFTRIEDEWKASVQAVLSISGQGELLDSNPLLKRSIQNRFPYIDPLNHLQVTLLKRLGHGDRNPRIPNGIALTINGIAAGLRNSG